MTADIRTAARAEAFNNRYSHKLVRDRYDADLLITGFMEGAVWAHRVTPTREQIAKVLANAYEPGDEVLPIDLDAAEAVLKLMQELAEA